MKTLKITITASIILTLGLVFTLIQVEDPLTTQYQQTVESLKEAGYSAAEDELMNDFPDLKKAKDNVQKVTRLKTQIESIIGGPAPQVNDDETIALRTIYQEIKKLRTETSTLLSLMLDQNNLVAEQYQS